MCLKVAPQSDHKSRQGTNVKMMCGLLSAKAPVFEEPKMSAAKLGNVRQHQLLEVLGYNSTRLGKEAKIVGM